MGMWDNTQALNEGWDLFEVDGRIQLQRIDAPIEHMGILNYTEPKFKSDAHALIEVALLANGGSTYHWNALGLIGQFAENLQ
jgi:hypothetical protein